MDSTLYSQDSVSPLYAAPFLSAYPQFSEAPIPTGSNAVRAWVGSIQPFSSDEDARRFLLCTEAGLSCGVDSGVLVVPEMLGTHPFSSFLLNMSQSCRLLILEQPTPAHPRAYLLNPAYDRAIARSHPHARGDQEIVLNGKVLIGMCIYSAAEHSYNSSDRLVQYVDLVTTHVARHLIWLRTRRLYRRKPDGSLALLYAPKAGEQAEFHNVSFDTGWLGYWPGPRAKATDAKEHFEKLSSKHECWCGSGIPYGECHRPEERRKIKGMRRLLN